MQYQHILDVQTLLTTQLPLFDIHFMATKWQFGFVSLRKIFVVNLSRPFKALGIIIWLGHFF